MKKNNLIFSILAVFIMLFTSCKEENDVIILDLQLSKTEITIEEGKRDHVKIEKGNGEYKVKSSNNNIKVELTDGEEIYINAEKEGTSTFVVSDSEGKTASVKVTITKKKKNNDVVEELSLSTKTLNIEVGSHEQVEVKGGTAPYTVVVTGESVSANLEKGEIHIEAKKPGESTVTVTDVKGKTASVKVTVSKKDNTNIVKDALFNEIHRIEIITHEGHLHGSYLHGNGGTKAPRAVKQYFILEKDAQGNFVHLTKNNEKAYVNPGESMVVLGKDFYGEKWTPPYAYEFVYYNKAGERLEEKFLKNKNMYQTLFSIEQYKVLATNEIKNVKTKDFMVYTYRDTKIATKMYSKSSDIESNFLGFKGYGYVKEARISYTLKVNFVKYKNSGDKVNSIFLEDAKQDKFDEKLLIEIPIVIPVGRSHDDQIKIMAAYYNMSKDDYEKLFWQSNPAESSKYYM